MKKIIMALVACIIAVILVLVIHKFNINGIAQNEDVAVDELKVIAISSFSNYAWSAQYRGMAIFNDGSIYSWDETDKETMGKYKLGTADGVQEFILNEGYKNLAKVLKNDLVKIKELINQVENNIELNHVGADMGTTTISVINENNEEIKLKASGDSMGENKTEKAKELLEILDKYF